MLTRFAGFFVGSVFGLVFVLVNSGPPLPPVLATVLRTLAVIAAVAIVVLVALTMRRESAREVIDARSGSEGAESVPERTRFDAFFGAVTLIEFALIFGGITLLTRLGAPPQTGVAWVALIVGLHFFPLALRWRQPEILFLAWYATVLGVLGLILVATGHAVWAPLVSGVLTGVGMLGGSVVAIVLLYRRSAPQRSDPR